MIHLLSLSEAQKADCDLKDGECLDEKQVFVQLRSEVRDSKDSDTGVAERKRWRWRRRNRRRLRRRQRHMVPPALPAPPPPVPLPVLLPVPLPAPAPPPALPSQFAEEATLPTPVLLEVDAEQFAGCCVREAPAPLPVGVNVDFDCFPCNGTMTVSLETPDMHLEFPKKQSLCLQELGNVSGGSAFASSLIISAGAEVVEGVWKFILEGSAGAGLVDGHVILDCQLTIFVEQCV